MKKISGEKKTSASKSKAKSRLSKTLRRVPRIKEKIFLMEPLEKDIPEEDREGFSSMTVTEISTTNQGSEFEDRGEDLANMRDPFVQGPERDTEIPPELRQNKAGETFHEDENLADQFDLERESEPPF